jgi:hypothetical protein
MAHARVITIDRSQRNWALSSSNRSWQRFWGKYERHSQTGIYIESGASTRNVAVLTAAFERMPELLRKVCLEWSVTFSFTDGASANGNASTFYADFTQRNLSLVSPHIEVGGTSLMPDFIEPHLAHELSHLFWRTRSELEREKFRQFLRDTTGAAEDEVVELTPYIQDLYASRLKHAVYESSYNEEAFCETVAVLTAPHYPSLDATTTVDLNLRRRKIEAIFGLALPDFTAKA